MAAWWAFYLAGCFGKLMLSINMNFKLIAPLSLLIWLSFFTARVYACTLIDTPKAKYETVKLEIERLKRQRTIQIYLPKSYAVAHKKFPVIYLQDGQNIFIKDAINTDNWFVDSLVNLMPPEKQCIIVAIHSGISRVRMQEYNPYMGLNDGAIYAAYVAKRIKPYIDSNYRTRPDAKYSAIAGSSMGGLIAMYIAAKYSDKFGVAGIFSPAFWYAPAVFDDVTKQPINPKSKFFFACGDAEGNERQYMGRMDSILLRKNFNIKNVPAPLLIKDGKHDEKQWRVAFEAFYNWFTAKL
jgi:predicted alpha/beta superfamily hydrolase